MAPPRTPIYCAYQSLSAQEGSGSTIYSTSSTLNPVHASQDLRSNRDLSNAFSQATPSSIHSNPFPIVGHNSSTTLKKRKQSDTRRSLTVRASSIDTPNKTGSLSTSTKPPSKNKRRKFYCGICNENLSNTPSKHICKHLVDICSSARRVEACIAPDSRDQVDAERLLLGCGYCGGTGTTRRYHGEAFLGLESLATHIYEQHCSPSIKLTWDISRALNNVLTSRVFRADYEDLRHLVLHLPPSAPLVWPWENDIETLLYDLEKLGGSLINADKTILPLDDSSRQQIVLALNVAFKPAKDNINSFARGPLVANTFSTAQNDAFGLDSITGPLMASSTMNEITFNYDDLGFGAGTTSAL